MDIPYKLNIALAANITCGQMELQVSITLFQDIFLFSFVFHRERMPAHLEWALDMLSSEWLGWSCLDINNYCFQAQVGNTGDCQEQRGKWPKWPSTPQSLRLPLATAGSDSIQPMLMFPWTVEERMRIVSVVGRLEVLDG